MTSTPEEIVAKAGNMMAAGRPDAAANLLLPLWSANRGHAKLRQLLSTARLAGARSAYENGDLNNAAERLASALTDDPDDARLHAHHAIVAQRRGDPAAAENAFETALSLAGAPGGPDGWIWTQAAMLARQAGRLDVARQHVTARLDAAPDDPEAAYAAAFIDLADGRMAEGWTGYEVRWRMPGFPSRAKVSRRPLWDGRPFDGRLLIWREQGLGDEVMFLRHLDTARARCDALIVECDPRLAWLLRRSFPDVDIRHSAPDLNPDRVDDAEFEAHLPIGSLPGRVAGDGPYPGAGAYLTADPQRRNRWRDRLREEFPGDRLVGLSWWSKNAEHGRTRSPGLAAWRPVTSLPGHRFVSLQYEGDADAATRHGIVTLPDLDPWQDIDGLAALIAALDAVVTIDNSTAHLAGAVGTSTELLLPFHRDWRWQIPVAGDGPLYASLGTHCQARPGDWAAPMAAVAKVLAGRH